MTPIWRKALPTPATPEELARESVVKHTLTKTLAQALKTLQQNHVNSNEPIVSYDSSDTVCDILEAIFIHGLKDTFVHRVTAILSGNIDKIPDPNFWPYLLIFTHKDVISQITHLRHICTDIGRSRAWLRIALNEGLLDSYLNAMAKDKKSLQYYYNHTAYLRDTEQPDILKKYIDGINILRFKLSFNVPILNQWSSTPLMLAGIWAPPLAPEPVSTGVDVASYCIDNSPLSLTPTRRRRVKPHESHLESTNSNNEPTSLPCLPSQANYIPIHRQFQQYDSSSSSPASCPDPPAPIDDYSPTNAFEDSINVNNDTIQNIEETIVQDVSDSSLDEVNQNSQSDSCLPHLSRSNSHQCFISKNSLKSPSEVSRGVAEGVAEALTSDDLENLPQAGNSLMGKIGWSSSFDDGCDNLSKEFSQHATVKESESFQTLLRNYSPVFGSVIRTPNFNDFIDSIITNPLREDRQAPQSPGEDFSSADILEYEVIPQSFSLSSTNLDARTRDLVALIGKIQNEKGLDSQNYQCKGCSSPIGMIFGKARVCGYDSCYYCSECHENDEYVIPARIIHNWDFKKFKVAKHTKRFLEQIEDEPLLDIRKFNSSLYTAIEEMNEMLNLRMQLNYLRSYLFTCRGSVVEELRKKVWPKEYLYDHVHLYALSDLLQISNGNLAQYLTKVINFAVKHVHGCRLCSLKGFICEICNSPKVVYPFELDTTYRCEECLAVFHASCMNNQMPCPKCRRRENRQGLNDYMWTVDDREETE